MGPWPLRVDDHIFTTARFQLHRNRSFLDQLAGRGVNSIEIGAWTYRASNVPRPSDQERHETVSGQPSAFRGESLRVNRLRGGSRATGVAQGRAGQSRLVHLGFLLRVAVAIVASGTLVGAVQVGMLVVGPAGSSPPPPHPAARTMRTMTRIERSVVDPFFFLALFSSSILGD